MPQTFMVIFFKHDDFAPKCNRNIINHLQVIFRGSLGVPFDIPPGYHRQLKKTSPSSTSSVTKRSSHRNKCHDLHRIGLFAKEIASLSHHQNKFGREITSPRSPQNKVAWIRWSKILRLAAFYLPAGTARCKGKNGRGCHHCHHWHNCNHRKHIEQCYFPPYYHRNLHGDDCHLCHYYNHHRHQPASQLLQVRWNWVWRAV